jgi:uncharacterized membrane protein
MGRRAASHRFRQTLKEELAAWREEGVVSPEQAAAITQRHRLDDLARESTGTLVSAIYIIGAVLIAAGVVSFVAWHWDVLPTAVKIVLMAGAMIGCHLGGFYLWQWTGRRERLGHGLVVMGTLLLGANIGLMAQIFHLHSDAYRGFAAWAVGAAAMAYAVRSVPNAVIAIAASFICWCGWHGDVWYYPFLAAALLLPFAYLKRSAFAFTLVLVAIGISLVFGWEWSRSLAPVVAMGAGVALLLVAWGGLSATTERFQGSASPALALGTVAAVGVAFTASFHDVARDMASESFFAGHTAEPTSFQHAHFGWPWLVSAAIVYAAAIGLYVWQAVRAARDRRRAARPLTQVVLATAALLLGSVVMGNDIFTTVAANVALVALAVGLVWTGLQEQSRRAFWAGLVVLAMAISGRLLEYETHLAVKAAVFLACGIGVIVGGVMFENALRKRRSADA